MTYENLDTELVNVLLGNRCTSLRSLANATREATFDAYDIDAETVPENACIRYEVYQNTVPGPARFVASALD